MRKVLIIAPHTDDGELGCGGTIARFIEEGDEVHYAAFSVCEDSVPAGLPKDILETELLAATTILEIKREWVHIFRYPVRRFNEFRQQILDNLIVLNKENHFDLVLMPSIHDVHQDHNVLAMEGRRAFKTVTLLSYELPWNHFTFDTVAFIGLEQRHINKKKLAVKAYDSQQGIRAYMDPDFIQGLARVRGVQVNKPYAEVFEVIRWVL